MRSGGLSPLPRSSAPWHPSISTAAFINKKSNLWCKKRGRNMRPLFIMDNGQWTIDNCGIFLRKMIEIVAFGDTLIVHWPLSIVHFYRDVGTVNRNLCPKKVLDNQVQVWYYTQVIKKAKYPPHLKRIAKRSIFFLPAGSVSMCGWIAIRIFCFVWWRCLP